MKKKKSRKKLVIGVVAVAVAAGGVKIYTGMNQGKETLPQVEVVAASRGDVQQTVETSGTGRWVEKRVRGGLPATGRSNERRKWIYFHSFFSQDKGKGRASECSRLHSSFH